MKIHVEENENLTEMELLIKCAEMNEYVHRLTQHIHQFELSFQGTNKGMTYALPATSVLYIESVDNKTFLYTTDDIYESTLKLYEFETYFNVSELIRISKNMIVNTSMILSVRALLNGKFEATLNNEEKVIVNRHYVKAFKSKFLS